VKRSRADSGSRTWIATLAALILATSVPIAWPLPAAAQPAPPAQSDEDAKAAARELANRAYEHYQAGEYGRAAIYFRDAEARFHAPTLLLMQAHSHRHLGQLVEARAIYQKIVDEQLKENATKEFIDAQSEAKKQVELMGARIATLKITFKGMSADKVHVSIDDVEIPTAAVLQPMPQNPGTHKIVATLGGDEGGRAVYQSVTLKEGTTKTVQLVFRASGPTEVPPTTGGCASCEIASPRGPAGPLALSLAMTVTALTALRRRRRPRRLPD
jgi:hypothetical protein